MAQDQKPQNQTPAQQKVQVMPDSPRYSRDSIPDDAPQHARYLFGKGWTCEGHPAWESAKWYPPDATDTETQVRVEKEGYIRRVVGREPNGQPIIEHKKEVLKEQDGSNPNNMGQPTVPVTQVRVTLPTQGVYYGQALEIDRARREKARRDAAAKAKEQKTAVVA